MTDKLDAETIVNVAHLLISSQFGSLSMVQRRVNLTYADARRAFEVLEQHGVIGTADGTAARDVLVRPDERDAVLAELETKLRESA